MAPHRHEFAGPNTIVYSGDPTAMPVRPAKCASCPFAVGNDAQLLARVAKMRPAFKKPRLRGFWRRLLVAMLWPFVSGLMFRVAKAIDLVWMRCFPAASARRIRRLARELAASGRPFVCHDTVYDFGAGDGQMRGREAFRQCAGAGEGAAR